MVKATTIPNSAADRAGALTVVRTDVDVLATQLVAVLAVRTERFTYAPLCRRIAHVVLGRTKPEMARIYAVWIVAAVADIQRAWIIASRYHPSDAWRDPVLAPQIEAPATKFVSAA
jgi:hypothetical protein